MLKILLSALVLTAALAGCADKEPDVEHRNTTINNPPAEPAHNTNTVIHEKETVKEAPAAPAGNTTINNNAAPASATP